MMIIFTYYEIGNFILVGSFRPDAVLYIFIYFF